MLFCSQQFVLFFLVVFVLYWAVPWRTVRIWLLLAASYYFYASWNHQLALLIAVSTFGDYLLARGMDGVASQRWRKAFLAISLIGNLSLLVYFKYTNFF